MAENINTSEVNELKNKGNACFQAGNYEEAIKHFSAAIALDPNNHILYSNRSASYASLKTYAKALEDAYRTIQLNADWAKGYSRKGTALFYMEQYNDALEAFNTGLKLEPENVQLKQGLQQVQLALKSSSIKKGVWGQLVTPYISTKPHPIVWDMVAEMVDWQVNKGCVGIFAVSPTSEMTHLSEDERVQLSTDVVKRVNGRKPVISCAGFGSTVEERVDSIKKMYSTGVAAVIIPVNTIVNNNEDDNTFILRMESVLKLTGDIPLGLLEQPGKNLSPATLSWISQTTKFVLYIDSTSSISVMKQKLEKISANPGLKYWTTSPTLLTEALRMGVSGFTGSATCLYPQLFVWLFENYQRADRENPEMIQRFLSVSQLTVEKGFPLSAKLYLHFGELTRMDGVTRVPQQPGFEINEEDMLRVNHLRDLVQFISLSLDEEKNTKLTSKKKDNSTLL